MRGPQFCTFCRRKNSAAAGFIATTRINRQHFGVSWNAPLDKGGIVASDEVDITIDAQAVMD